MAMYNLYRGNGGRPERVAEPFRSEERPMPTERSMPEKKPAPKPQRPPKDGLSVISKKLGELETEDILLILILYLMYRESGDTELLVIMGAMYLM